MGILVFQVLLFGHAVQSFIFSPPAGEVQLYPYTQGLYCCHPSSASVTALDMCGQVLNKGQRSVACFTLRWLDTNTSKYLIKVSDHSSTMHDVFHQSNVCLVLSVMVSTCEYITLALSGSEDCQLQLHMLEFDMYHQHFKLAPPPTTCVPCLARLC